LGAAPPAAGGDGAKFYLQKGSKMNEADFDQGYETEQPF
jgi:replicative DNA helicase